jgi:hypothetical protein
VEPDLVRAVQGIGHGVRTTVSRRPRPVRSRCRRCARPGLRPANRPSGDLAGSRPRQRRDVPR